MSLFAGPSFAQIADSSAVGRFQLAEGYIRAAQFDRALRLLEDLHAEYPDTPAFYDRLKSTYESVKRYDEAIALVERRMKAAGSSLEMQVEKARLLYLKGDEAAAFRLWDEALAAAPKDRQAYRTVFESLYAVRLLDRAIEVLEKARDLPETGTSVLGELAYLYNMTGRHDQAMQAYLDLLEENGRQVAFVRNRISRFTEQPEVVQTSIAVVEKAVRQTPLNRAYREILGWLYTEGRDYRKALDTWRALDRIEKESGYGLYQFARYVADQGAYDVALEAFEEVRLRHADAPVAAEALLGIGRLHEQWAEASGERIAIDDATVEAAPHYRKALETYQLFISRYPNSDQYPEVLRRVGALQRDVFFNLDAAEMALRQVMNSPVSSPATDQAEFDVGRLAILRGDLEEAKLVFHRILERLRTGELAEAARYEIARLHFYAGEFEAARTLAEAINENTSTDVANDAIELRVVLIENPGPDSLNTPLRRYARAHLLNRQNRPREAMSTLDSLLTEAPAHPLADDARFLRAEALRMSGRYEEAATAFGEVTAMFPESFLADRSLFYAAQVFEQDLRDMEKAIAAYTRLLTEYPGSLYESPSRARIRALRGDGVS